MTLIPDTKDTTPQTLQNGYPAGSPAVNLNTPRCLSIPIRILTTLQQAVQATTYSSILETRNDLTSTCDTNNQAKQCNLTRHVINKRTNQCRRRQALASKPSQLTPIVESTVHTWIVICASLNHRKKAKADGSRLIPRKHTETLVLSSDLWFMSLCYEILIVVLSLFFLCCCFSLSTFHP